MVERRIIIGTPKIFDRPSHLYDFLKKRHYPKKGIERIIIRDTQAAKEKFEEKVRELEDMDLSELEEWQQENISGKYRNECADNGIRYTLKEAVEICIDSEVKRLRELVELYELGLKDLNNYLDQIKE